MAARNIFTTIARIQQNTTATVATGVDGEDVASKGVAVIVILSLLVLAGLLFLIFGLLLKAEAYGRLDSENMQQNLLFSDKDCATSVDLPMADNGWQIRVLLTKYY